MTLALCLAAAPALDAAAWAASVDDLVFRGADHQYHGRLDQAAQAFSQALRLDPGNEFALSQLALVQARRERFDEAEGLFARVVANWPDNTFARLWLGVLRLRADDAQAAFERFNEVLALDPDNAGAYYFLGVMYAVEHKPAKAVEHLRKAQAKTRGDPDLHHRLATAFLSLDMAANAELELNRTLEQDPRNLRALNDLGWLYYNSGRRALALESWRQALSLAPGEGEARSNLAKVFNDEAWAMHRAGDEAGARRLWRQVLEVDPKNKAAAHHLR